MHRRVISLLFWCEKEVKLVTTAAATSSVSTISTPSRLLTLAFVRKMSSSAVAPLATFDPKRVLILTKMTRYQFEKRRYDTKDDAVLRKELTKRGSDFDQLLAKHQVHQEYLDTIVSTVADSNRQVRVVQRFDYTPNNINWADAILTAGGDGTFLLAASKVTNCEKPVIGINTDPVSSEGYMCLMKKLPVAHFKKAFDRLLQGNFEWLYRQRIRVTLHGHDAWQEPIELHEQQLLYPEYRWVEHVKEQEESRSSNSVTFDLANGTTTQPCEEGTMSRTLPCLALNEVYIGESLSSRVSYYELIVDNGPPVKQKSSGLTVCTGTGSTSWYFNINKMTTQSVAEVVDIIAKETNRPLPTDPKVCQRICDKFNEQLTFHPSDQRMVYATRDPVFNATFPAVPQRGFVRDVRLRSRCWDAHLVIDGGLSYTFNDGACAHMDIRPEDALKTVVFR